MLQYALARLEGQIQAVERGITLLEKVDNAEALQIVLEAAMTPHASMKRVLPGMAEWRMAEIMGERDRLGEVLIEAQSARDRARNLRDLETVRETGTEMIAFMIDEDLRLVL